VESLEQRMLMANNFLAGTAFIDSNSNGQLDTTESYLAGATIQLRTADGLTVLAQQVTDAKGAYFFNNVAPGDYKLVNLSASGYVSTASQALSKISPVTGTTFDSINVSLSDPADLKTSIDINAFFASGQYRAANYTVFGTSVIGSAGQLPAKLHSTIFTPNPTSPFLTLCTDLFNDLDFGVNGPYTVTPNSIPVGSGSPHNAERIAYLYNHYGQTPQGADNAAGLQVAVWELLYDADNLDPDGDLTSGNFRIDSLTAAATARYAQQRAVRDCRSAASCTGRSGRPPWPGAPDTRKGSARRRRSGHNSAR